jgi:uncharacterized protein (UPF0548 family)
MLCINRPNDETLGRFLAQSASDGLSYDPSRLVESSGGFNVDEERFILGHGAAVFARACMSLRAWQHFAFPWISIYPPDAAIAPGITVVVAVRYLGLWWLNACRIVRVVSEDPDCWGFAYGTLWAHAESGEESFMVAIQPSDGLVTYHLRAASRPRALVARLGYPFTRALQSRFRRDSGAAMERAITSGAQ